MRRSLGSAPSVAAIAHMSEDVFLQTFADIPLAKAKQIISAAQAAAQPASASVPAAAAAVGVLGVDGSPALSSPIDLSALVDFAHVYLNAHDVCSRAKQGVPLSDATTPVPSAAVFVAASSQVDDLSSSSSSSSSAASSSASSTSSCVVADSDALPVSSPSLKRSVSAQLPAQALHMRARIANACRLWVDWDRLELWPYFHGVHRELYLLPDWIWDDENGEALSHRHPQALAMATVRTSD
jgi:hypothetical protein